MHVIFRTLALNMIGVGLLASCGAKTPAYDAVAVKTEASAAFQQYFEFTSQGEVQSAAALYDDDPDFHWVERGRVQYESAAEAAASLLSIASQPGAVRVALNSVKATDLSATSAFVSGEFEFEMTDAEGRAIFSMQGWTSVGMKKIDGQWRIAAGQSSSVDSSSM